MLEIAIATPTSLKSRKKTSGVSDSNVDVSHCPLTLFFGWCCKLCLILTRTALHSIPIVPQQSLLDVIVEYVDGSTIGESWAGRSRLLQTSTAYLPA